MADDPEHEELKERCESLRTFFFVRSPSLTSLPTGGSGSSPRERIYSHSHLLLRVRVRRAQKHISFGDASPKNVEQLRKLNLAVFPVRYNDKFYEDLANNRQGQLPYTHLAYFADIMVGAICCRVEPVATEVGGTAG